MAGTVTWERLRELAGFRAAKGCAISFYLDLDPSVAPTAGDAQTRVNSLLAEGERMQSATRRELTREQRDAVKGDLDRIRRYVDDDFDRDGSRGLALFAAGLDNFWSVLALTDPVDDAIKIGSQFYLAPLVPLVGRGDGALVAMISRERGDVYRLRNGRLVAVADLTEEQPSRHDQGGWSQARFQRHIDNLAAEHMRTVAEELNRRVRRSPGAGIVIFCTEENRSEVADLLAHEARADLAGWAQAEAHATPAELLELALPVLDRWRAKHEERTLERWREEAGRNGRAAGGWPATLEAASDGRVDILLVQDGSNRQVWQCPACGRAAADGGSCPLDGTRMELRDEGVDVAVHQTLAHGGTIWAVRHHRDLDPVQGIGALLRF